jgi:energy-coupling factor transporter ATP-binding protein EcfA2
MNKLYTISQSFIYGILDHFTDYRVIYNCISDIKSGKNVAIPDHKVFLFTEEEYNGSLYDTFLVSPLIFLTCKDNFGSFIPKCPEHGEIQKFVINSDFPRLSRFLSISGDGAQLFCNNCFSGLEKRIIDTLEAISDDLELIFGQDENDNNVSISIKHSENYYILGRSGVGKTIFVNQMINNSQKQIETNKLSFYVFCGSILDYKNISHFENVNIFEGLDNFSKFCDLLIASNFNYLKSKSNVIVVDNQYLLSYLNDYGLGSISEKFKSVLNLSMNKNTQFFIVSQSLNPSYCNYLNLENYIRGKILLENMGLAKSYDDKGNQLSFKVTI